MKRINILMLETIADEAFQILNSQGNFNIFYAFESTIEEIISKNEINCIITRGKGQVKKELIEAIPTLKVIARCGVGLDNIDVEEATKLQIKVINAPGSNAKTIAEHTIALMLILKRNLHEAIYEAKKGNWNWRNQYEGDELNTKTLGILGMGNIGQKVANIAHSLGMNVQYSSKNKKENNFKFVDFETLFKTSDIISIHLPLTDETNQLFNQNTFKLLKKNTILINTSRDQIINKSDLLDALNSDLIAGYAADVPMISVPVNDDPILIHPKTIITPHIGSLTKTTYSEMCVSTIKNLIGVLNNQDYDSKSVFNLNNLING